MTDIFDKIKNKRIVIWGIGSLQKDLEGLYDFLKILYYVEDSILEKNKIGVLDKKIYPSQKLKDEKKENLMIILCTGDPDKAVEKLSSMGYKKEHYILGEELLINYFLYKQIQNKKIYLWGTGGSFFYREELIRKYIPDYEGFIVTQKNEETFQGKNVLSMEEIKNQSDDLFIIVVSIYYKEIYANLVRMGFTPGKDFLHIDTFLNLGKFSTRTHGVYQFIDRQNNEKDLLVVLAGYKEFVWESVFSRLQAYLPKTIDVCIVTSGLVNEDLKQMCEKQKWSYLSTEKNNISLALNLAIYLHPEAEYVYKMDEDIFLTENTFQIMKDTYQYVQQKSNYVVGFVAPLIPVNGYSYVKLLERFQAKELWEERFGTLKYTDCCFHHKEINSNPDAAMFMWGEGNPNMNNLDEMQKVLNGQEMQYSICPIRYSIGFILFRRENWIHMRTFPIIDYMNIGADEEALCKFCMMQSRVMVIAENAVVGHLAYGMQNKVMEQYYYQHKEKFLLPTSGEMYELC